ncbi:hypothetical protein PV08_07214 [Exophiala spinifera]|uniref:HBS1-like protein N-terminal domain-containing protein n=1 Tax=Exophiala spinifera TaxID=91928 RepID=A0A0D1YHN4_9EURO|nr:uncharacterized protein PV08_07214 [Exophiala spinifera]KIW14431.1 hypothetical protein PV08_07214 [Exophiala spinifera]
MSNRRVKSLALEDDDYDDYDDYDENYDEGGDNELSPEDKEQMRLGTIKVREDLGSAYKLSDTEIQEALWHYYYDINKCVAYLKSIGAPSIQRSTSADLSTGKHKPTVTPSKKTPAETRSKSIFSVDATPLLARLESDRGGHECSDFRYGADGEQELTNHTVCSTPFSAAEFFKDCPWLSVPEHRKAVILIEPLYPRGGLLGGSSGGGKPSKLAALAAKRRQKENERSASNNIPTPKSDNDYVARLRSLHINGPAAQQRPTTTRTNESSKDHIMTDDLQVQRPEDDSTLGSSTEHGQKSETPNVPEPVIRAPPSAFASIMTSHDFDERHLQVSPNLLLPALDLSKFAAFAEPSPDDVVSRAQNAKGRS